MTVPLTSITGGRGDPPGNDQGERLAKLEARLDTILPTLATKSDVSESKATIVMWVAGIAFASTALIVSVMAYMLNHPIAQAPQQPIQKQ